MNEPTNAALVAGRYLIQRPLGEGATKHVYLAEDRFTGAQVALSLLVADLQQDASWDARFTREARIGTTLHSPYVVRVFDHGSLDDGTSYLSTEAVLGRGMHDALANGPVAVDLAVRWICQVLGALSLAHQHGIVHRDIKPDNVLLARTTDYEVAKLADFGIAKLLDATFEPVPTVKTEKNIVLGTPHYMAPEQWQGIKVDGRTDLYAAGAMFFELLTGRTPFEEETDLHMLAGAHMTSAPPPLPDDAPPAIRAFEHIWLRALSKKPGDRYPTADAMREAIEKTHGTYRLADEPSTYEAVLPAPFAHAELSSELWPAPIQLIATPTVVLGRDPDTHVSVRCMPSTPENDERTRTISRRHAQIQWHGGRAQLTDLGSNFGTRAGGQKVSAEPTALFDGDEISLGPHARMNFQHAPARAGALPRWARLVRTDDYGSDQLCVLVLTEARIGADEEAAIPVPAYVTGDQSLRIRAHATGLALYDPATRTTTPLEASMDFPLGELTIHVTLRG